MDSCMFFQWHFESTINEGCFKCLFSFGADVPLSFNQKINQGTRNKEGSKWKQDLKIELQIVKMIQT